MPATELKQDEVSEIVAHILKSLEGGAFLVTEPPEKPVLLNGWTMPHPSGKAVSRSTLQAQCSAIIPYGWRAVPELLKQLDNKEQFVRYIAAYSLERITGLHPTFYYFGTPHEQFNGDRDWFDNAKKTWSKWYDDLLQKN